MKDYRKYFGKGINADDDFEEIDPEQWINSENVRIDSTDNGATRRVESIGGTDLIFGDLPTEGINLCNGGCTDDSKNRIFWMNYNSTGKHGIYCFDKTAGKTYTVLLDEDVEGGLLFSKDHYIHSCFFVNNNIFWVNGTNTQPRRINVESGIKAHHATYVTDFTPYSLPISVPVIMWIRRPPGLPPTQQKVTQTSPARENNFIKDAAFQFCYLYNFRDYEVSTLSSYSSLANYNELANTFNRIDVAIPLGEKIDQDVISLDLVAILLPENKYYVIKTWDKSIPGDLTAINNHNSGSAALSFAFYNDSLQRQLDPKYVLKPYDSIPLFAETAAPARNRNFMADYIEGYDTPKSTSLAISFDFINLTPATLPTIIGTWGFGYLISNANPLILFLQDVIRTNVPLLGTEPPSGLYFYICTPPTTGTLIPTRPATVNSSDCVYIAGNEADALYQLYLRSGFTGGVTPSSAIRYNYTTPVSSIININSSFIGTVVAKVFKTQGVYNLGVTFYDKYQRKCGVVPTLRGITTYDQIISSLAANVSSTSPNTLVIDLSFFDFIAGDKVVLPTSTISGTYTVQSVVNVGSIHTITTVEPIVTMGSTSINIGVLRPVIGDGSIQIPSAYINHNYVTFINWILDNTNALEEIPEFAEYYSVDITKCLTTRFFFDSFGLARYVQKDVNGLYDYGATGAVWTGFKVGIAIDTTPLSTTGIGYEFQQGDICRILVNGVEYSLSVIDTDGKYIILESANVGTLSSTTVLYEIFSPYKRQDKNELYFEVGQMCKVLNPGTNTRAYGTLKGQISGDVYLQKRSYISIPNQFFETMNINYKFWKVWNTDHGRPNAIDTIGQVQKKNSFCWSDVYIGDTKINGLCSYSALNTENVPVENGPIRKLQLAQKVAEKGTILLAICEVETCSIYLGESQFEDNTGNTFLVKSAGLIGNIYALKGSMGTKNPESVEQYNGLVWFWDMRNSSLVQYSDNGLDSLSKNKLSRVSNLFSKKYNSLTAVQIEALGSRPYVIIGIDPHHKEVLVTIPSTEDTPPKGYLEDYDNPKIPYPYDVYDGIGKTLVYKKDKDYWMSPFTFEAEKFIRLGNDLYAFKHGKLYRMNSTTNTKFFGKQFKAKLMFSNNINPGTVKTNLALGLDCNMKPEFVHFRTEDPYIQSSDLVADNFKVREGVKYAGLKRDRLSPNYPGTVYEKWECGDRMFGKTLLTMLQFDVSTARLELRYTHIGNNINKGHLILKS